MAATVQRPQFSCHVERTPLAAVVVPVGELDLDSVRTLEHILAELLLDDPHSLRVDLRELTFVDSTGLRCLLELATRARADGFDLDLVPGPDSVMRLFDLTGTRDVLPFGRDA